MFLHNSEGLISKLPSYLVIFSLIFGLRINLQKSMVFNVGRDVDTTAQIEIVLGAKLGTFLCLISGFHWVREF